MRRAIKHRNKYFNSDKEFEDYIEFLKVKYKCTAADNTNWCDGTKIGSRMRCPFVMFCTDGSHVCELGI